MLSLHKSGNGAKKLVRSKGPIKSRSYLLIIECNSRKLATDRLNLGSAFERLAMLHCVDPTVWEDITL